MIEVDEDLAPDSDEPGDDLPEELKELVTESDEIQPDDINKGR